MTSAEVAGTPQGLAATLCRWRERHWPARALALSHVCLVTPGETSSSGWNGAGHERAEATQRPVPRAPQERTHERREQDLRHQTRGRAVARPRASLPRPRNRPPRRATARPNIARAMAGHRAEPRCRPTPTRPTPTWYGSCRPACSPSRSPRSPTERSPVASSTGSAAGTPKGTAVRHRASLSAFFAWCTRERYILTNPVTGVRVPRQSTVPTEMSPFTEEELESAYRGWQQENARLADILLVLGWTGLRWSEARAARVEDLMQVPTPGLMIRRAAPRGGRHEVDQGAAVAPGSARQPRASARARDGRGQGAGRPALHDRRRRAAPPDGDGARRELASHRSRASHPRPAPHRCLPLAVTRRRPGNGPGVDGSRVHRDHESLPALPRYGGPSSGSGAAESASGGRRGAVSRPDRRMTIPRLAGTARRLGWSSNT